MFYACVQKFDGMNEKILDGKALLSTTLTLQTTGHDGCFVSAVQLLLRIGIKPIEAQSRESYRTPDTLIIIRWA